MILDATAGNRTMWRHKDSENIIYVDIEKRLEVKPTLFADDRKLPFRGRQFDTIFFDPPHAYGGGSLLFTSPFHTAEYRARFRDKDPTSYYGWDKYKTKSELLRYIYQAQAELRRVLKDDGLLWLKWNEMNISVRTILHLLQDWRLLLELPVKHKAQRLGKMQTYWLCLEKKLGTGRQLTL